MSDSWWEVGLWLYLVLEVTHLADELLALIDVHPGLWTAGWCTVFVCACVCADGFLFTVGQQWCAPLSTLSAMIPLSTWQALTWHTEDSTGSSTSAGTLYLKGRWTDAKETARCLSGRWYTQQDESLNFIAIILFILIKQTDSTFYASS